jgi:glycosyltransferase involved in cell wall biosynthesis
MKILFISSNHNNPNHYLARAAFDALTQKVGTANALWGEYSNAIDTAARHKPEALIVFDGQSADNPIIKRLTELCPIRAIWFCEDPYELGVNKVVAENFDLVFTNDLAACESYGNKATHLPLAASRENNFFPLNEKKHRYDVFFAGTAWPNRLRFIAEVKRQLPELKWKLILVSNPQLDGHIKDIRAGLAFSAGVSIRDFSALSNQSAITLVLPRNFSTSEELCTSSQTPGPRLFEAALAGGCQLVDINAMPIAGQMLPINEAFIPFENLSGCVELIKKLLADNFRRNKVAEIAQGNVMNAHLFDQRVAVIYEKIMQIKAIKSNIVNSVLNSRPRILFVAHNTTTQGAYGGSEIYLSNVIKNMADVYDCYVWAHDTRNGFGQTYRLYGPDGVEMEVMRPSLHFHDTHLSHLELEHYLQGVINGLSINVVFFNHLIGFPPALLRVQKAYGCKSVFVLHDYYAVCDSFNLLNHQKIYCQVNSINEDICNACTYKRRGLLPGSQARRRRFLREVFRDIDLVISGSQSSEDIVTSLLPELRRKALLRAPAMNKPDLRPTSVKFDLSKLHIALVGNFSANKGASLAIELFKTMRNDAVVFHVFGDVKLPRTKRNEFDGIQNVVLHGSYSQGILPGELAQCQIGLILSNWPETYCMVLSELWYLGIVPIASSLGALAERITDGVDGLLLKTNDPAEIRCQILQLAENDLVIKSLRENRARNPCPDAKEYTEWLKGEVLKLCPVINQPIAKKFDHKFSISQLGLHLTHMTWAINGASSALAPNVPKNVSWHKKVYRTAVAIKKAIKKKLQ